MKVKTITITILILFCLAILVACQFEAPLDDKLIYKSSQVEVRLVDHADEMSFVHYEWLPLTDEEAYRKNTVIMSGVASNVRQATLEYNYLDTDVRDNITVFDIEVSELLSSRSGSFQQGDLVTVGVGYNMNTYGEELPVVEDGKSYLLFCYVAIDQKDDALELAHYVDCWISAPKDLFLEKIGDFYLSVDYFSKLPEALPLVDYLGLTEENITRLASIAVDDTDAVTAFIDEIILSAAKDSYPPEAAEALRVLKTRTGENPVQLWYLVNRSSLIRSSELEAYVQKTALAYGSQ